MCVMSMVMDQYNPYFPPEWTWTWPSPAPYPLPDTTPAPIVDPDKLEELIESFRKAVAAAEVFDRLTGQPDCVDPEKGKLLERVAELEAQIKELRETLAVVAETLDTAHDLVGDAEEIIR